MRTLGEGQTRHLVHSQEDGEFDVSTDHGLGEGKAPWKIYAGQAENCDAAAGCHDHGESRLPRKTCNPGGVDGTDSHCVVKRRVRVLQVCVAQQQRRIYGNVVKVALETLSVSDRDMSRRLGAAKVRHVDMGAWSLPAVKQRSDRSPGQAHDEILSRHENLRTREQPGVPIHERQIHLALKAALDCFSHVDFDLQGTRST